MHGSLAWAGIRLGGEARGRFLEALMIFIRERPVLVVC
jgi:hypothetical protein